MSDIIRVKAKKSYQWNQDPKFLFIRIPMPSHTSLKKIQIYLSDLILRITSLQKKSTHFLDLHSQIDYLSPQNKFILSQGEIHCTLKKKQPIEWNQLLIQDISLNQLKIRRRQSQQRYQQNIQEVEKMKDTLRQEYDRKATQEMMRFQDQERKILNQRKQNEKQQAINQIFANVNQNTGKIQQKPRIKPSLQLTQSQSQPNHAIQNQQKKWKQKELLALKIINQEQEKQKNQLNNQIKQKNKKKMITQIQKQVGVDKLLKPSTATSTSKSIFTEQDVQKFNVQRQVLGQTQYQQIPVRKTAGKIQVKFTQRLFPHLAARESHFKQPQMPKSKSTKPSQGDLQSKNPLWLKDKGDQFLHDKNYLSAIQAYTQAIKLDDKMINAYANRSLGYLKIFQFQKVIGDCQIVLGLMQGQLAGGQQDNVKSAKFMVKIQARKAIAKAWKGELTDAKKELIDITSNNQNLNLQTKDQINKSIQLISQREQSIEYKLKGDEQVKVGNFERAIAHYDQSIAVDKNQYSISNKALCLNKIKDFHKSIDTINEGIQRIGFFNINLKNQSKQDIKVNQNKKPQTILLKLYYRKAKALQQLNKLKQSQQAIHKGLSIDSSDKDFLILLKQVNLKKTKQVIKSQKQVALLKIKQGHPQQALAIYSKCIKMMQYTDDLQQYLGILQNQCVCYLKINDFDSIITTAIRILKIVDNVRSRIVEFGGKKISNIPPEEINRILVRTLMRRANAYLNKSQVYNAKADLQKALEISPRDQNVLKQLEKIKIQLNV